MMYYSLFFKYNVDVLKYLTSLPIVTNNLFHFFSFLYFFEILESSSYNLFLNSIFIVLDF
jgi:hypothetical protein